MSLRNPITFGEGPYRATTLSLNGGSRGVNPEDDNPTYVPPAPSNPPENPGPQPLDPTIPMGKIPVDVFINSQNITIDKTPKTPEEARENFQKRGIDDATFDKFFEVVQDEKGKYTVQPKAPFEFQKLDYAMQGRTYLVDPDSGVKVTIDANLIYSNNPSIEALNLKDSITYTDSNGNKLNNDGTINKDVIDKSTIEGYQNNTEITVDGANEEEILENLRAKTEELINTPEFVADLKAQYQATLVFDGKTYNEAEFNKLFEEALEAAYKDLAGNLPPMRSFDNGASLVTEFNARFLVDVFLAKFTNTVIPQSVKDAQKAAKNQEILDKGGYVSYNVSALQDFSEQLIDNFFIPHNQSGKNTMFALKPPYTGFEIKDGPGNTKEITFFYIKDGNKVKNVVIQAGDGTWVEKSSISNKDKIKIESYNNMATAEALKANRLPQGLIDELFELQNVPAGYENYFDDTQRYTLKDPYRNYTVTHNETSNTTLITVSYIDNNGIMQNKEFEVYPNGTYTMTNETNNTNIVYENGIMHEIL